MANARAVEEVSISGKTRKKTNVFWSTVPENEQFKNVQVPGVALGGLKDAKNNSQAQKYAQVVQKSKSDSAILNTRSDPLTVNKPGKVGHELAMKQNDLSGKKKDVSSIFKGAVSSDQLANMSSLSESSNPRRASLKNLNVEDKKRVANLIKELAKTGEERELALERLQEERVSFDERLGAVQDEQTALRQEREALKQRLEKSEKLLKKYESELKDVKTEKEEQEKILKKKFQAQPQSTQTSPSIQTLSTDSTIKSRVDGIQPRGIKKTLSTQVYAGDSEGNDRTSRDGRMRWGSPQVPVYSNSLFDVKVSNVEHEQNSESQSVNEEYQRSNVVESGGLHELYLREYSLQLRLQEQQIEIQRQQVQLQQQLQLLQQQQQQQGVAQQRQEQHPHQQQQQQQELAPKHQENKEQQFPNQQQQQEQYHLYHQQQQRQREISNKSHKQQTNQHSQNVDQKHQQQPRLNQQQPYGQPSKWHQQEPQYLSTQNNETMSKHSPTQQTNLLQKRTPEPRGQHIEPKHEADTIPHEHSDLLPRRHKHDHHTHVVKNSRHENEAVLYEQYGEPRSKDRSYTRQRSGGPSSHNHHHSRNDSENTSSVGEYHTNRNKAQHCTDSTHYRSEQHHMTKTKSPRKHNRTNDVKQVDLNNNEYFQPRSHSPKQQKNHYDVNGNLVQDHYLQEYLSEPYSETDDQTDVEHHYSSERPCHCGYYHKHTRQEHLTSEYDHPISKHSHSKGIPQHGINQKSPQSIAQNPHLEAKPHPTQTYQHPKRHQLSPNRTKGYHQKLMHDPNHAPVPPLGHHHKAQYRHHRGTRVEHSSQRNDHYQHVPHYVTHKHQHANEPAFDAVIYQASQETSSSHEPTEHRVYVRHQSGSPTNAQLPPSTNTQLPQVGITEYDYLPSDGRQQPRTQMNQDKSQDLLDDYIYNHQTVGQYNAKLNADYPKDKGNKHSTKRKISRLREVDTIQESEHDYPPTTYTASQQPQYEDENPGYSLYKPNIQETTWKQSEHPGRSPGHNHGQYSRPRSKSYPDSLVEIVEDLEINDGYEKRYSEETEVYSTEELGYDSDEEESTVLDNIFFLKR